MKKKTKVLIGIGLIVVLAGLGAMLALNHIENNLNSLSKLNIPKMDLTNAKDGTYSGSYDAFPVSAQVEVIVQDHKIIRIDLVDHVTGQGQAADSLPASVTDSQSLQVELVSGATYSSVVILKAIEDALRSAGANSAVE